MPFALAAFAVLFVAALVLIVDRFTDRRLWRSSKGLVAFGAVVALVLGIMALRHLDGGASPAAWFRRLPASAARLVPGRFNPATDTALYA